jgi:hypothetical protein
MPRHYVVIEERKDPSGWWIVLIAAILIAFWKFIMVAVIVGMIVGYLLIIRKTKSDRKRVSDAWLAIKADHQNMLAAMGDPVGTYGEYDVYTMPITAPYYKDDPVYDLCWPNTEPMYNDGMRDR